MQPPDDYFKGILDHLLEGCQIIGFDWRYLYLNDVAAQHARKQKSELLGHSLMDVYPGIAEMRLFQTLARCMEARVSASVDHEFAYPDGAKAWFELSVQPVPEGILVMSLDITERKRAFEEIDRLAKFPEENPNPVLRFGRDGRVLYANSSSRPLLALWGCELGGPCPEDMCRLVSEAFATGASVEVEVACGQTIYSLVFTPILDADYVNIYGRDITERKQAEIVLRESEERYRGLFEHMLEGFAYCRMIFENGQARDWIYLAVNDKFETLTGLKDVTGKRVSQVIPGIREADPELFDIYARVSLTGKPEKFETFVEALQMWFSISVYSPQREFFVAVFDVITERKRAEAALRESEERYRTVGETIPYGVWLTDATGYCTYVSDSFLDLVGMTLEQVQRFGWLHLLPPEDVQPTTDHWLHCVQTGADFEREHRFRTKDGGYRNVLAIGRPVRDERGQITSWVGLNLDITDRKRAEEEIHQLNAELEQRVAARTAQLEAANHELEAFAYSVSHDLRAPLRAIDGFSRIVLEDYADKLDAEGNRLLNVIRNNAGKMDRLIADLLALSRVSRGELHFSRIDMTGLAHAVYHEIASPQVQQKFDFSVAPLPAAQGDPTLMRQVWDNLIANALKYTMPKDERRIEIGGYAENGMNVYYVKDSGVGFNPDYTHKLFGVFQRLHKEEEFEGTGVGLAIVQRIVHRHGGRTWAEGKVDRGATLYFSLPGEDSDHD